MLYPLTQTAPCVLCGGPLGKWFTKQGREIYRCRACRLVTVPAGTMLTEDGVSIYEDEDNIFLQDGNDNYYFDETNLWSCRLKVKLLRKYLPAGARVVDAGANFGHFLRVAQEVYDASGFDLSPQAVRWSREHFGVRNRTASLYDPPADLGPADAVTCWDVIEHVPDPLAALDRLRQLLRPGGLLFLSTPDAGSAAARALGRFWHYLDPVQHINLFTFSNLTMALQKTGLAVISRCSFGRYYQLEYVFDRLTHLHKHRLWRKVNRLGKRLLRPVLRKAVYIKLGDVLGLVARRPS
jgi:SAM-dependent methyltransferase